MVKIRVCIKLLNVCQYQIVPGLKNSYKMCYKNSYSCPTLTLPYMVLLSDRQAWGALWPPFFLAIYILYGVLVVICLYIPINRVCTAIFRLHWFLPAALWRHFGSKWRHFMSKLAPITKDHSFCKNNRLDLKIGQHTCFDALNP